MTRTLPWKRQGLPPRPPAAANHRSFSPDLPATSHDERRQSKPASVSKGPHAQRVAHKLRSPSTSPPPAPPDESFMIDGMDHDDQYRMVEDEFLAVARTFTAHLHAAEYQRLKVQALAKRQTTDAHHLGDGGIVRPVVGAPTDRVRRRQETAQRMARQQRGLRRALAVGGGEKDSDGNGNGDGDENEEDTPWAGTALENLMEGGPQRESKLLPMVARLPVLGGFATQHAAVKQQPSAPRVDDTGIVDEDDDDDDDEDDLDGPSTFRSLSRSAQATARDVAQKTPASTVSMPAKRTVSFATNTQGGAASPSSGSSRNANDESDDNNDDNDGLSDVLDSDYLLQKLRKRRETEKAQRQLQRTRQRHQTAHTHAQADGGKAANKDSLSTIIVPPSP
ncbi:hypothetical protein SPI_00479 [Niveomyces insectorum RCEF 264]|uniref:Uncharacterized protein n=1 Tax=Niveomyces insectorum RCEF 264 TaxID=1081102 RepID=A0A162LBM2_9HYPO|nr:hypothetical protein SPI_00479 [Niveomyces insectorum RCEF 264]